LVGVILFRLDSTIPFDPFMEHIIVFVWSEPSSYWAAIHDTGVSLLRRQHYESYINFVGGGDDWLGCYSFG
jgi:hypothetical protein